MAMSALHSSSSASSASRWVWAMPIDARHEDFVALDVEGYAKGVEEPVCEGLGLRARCFVEDDRELVAAETCDGVTVTDDVPKAGRHVDEESITCFVTEGVVDHLEPVEVAEQDRDRCGRASGSGQCVFEAVTKQCSVRKTGEVVVKRLVYQLVDKMLAFRDVAEAPDPSDDLVVDTLRARVSFEHPTVFEHEGVVTDRVGLRVELVDLSDENLWVDELIEYQLDRRYVIPTSQEVLRELPHLHELPRCIR